MTLRSLCAGYVALGLLLSFSSADLTYAYSSSNPNLDQNNFRRPRGDLIRYQNNKRALSRQNSQDYNTASGSLSTFDRRAEILREAQLKRIQEDINQREYSGERRKTPHYWDRYNRSGPSTLRRINRAEREGGVRHGLPPKRTNQQIEKIQLKRQLQQEYRKQVLERQKAQRDAVNKDNASECGDMSGRRYALCLYRLQRND